MKTTSRTDVDANALASPKLANSALHDPSLHRVTVFSADGHECSTWMTMEQAGRIAEGWISVVGAMALREYGFDPSPDVDSPAMSAALDRLAEVL
jgi:hypothetical protein